jgi:ribosomal protein S6--L-glutamate ligase
MNILILNSAPSSYATQSLVTAGEKKGHKMIIMDPAYFSPLVSNIESGYDRLYDLLPKTAARLTIRDIDVIIPRIGNNLTFNSYIVEHFTENLGIYSTQSASGIRAAASKFHTLQICSRHGIRTPITLYAKSANNIDFLIEKVGGIPLILKYNYGSQGAGVMIMESRKSAISTIEGLLKNKSDFIVQQFIPSKNQDIRAIVIGDRVIAAYRRTAVHGDFRSNLSLGGIGELIQLSMDDQILCVKASRAIGLEVSGVDLIKDEQGNTFLNELNSNFGLKGQKITKINVGEYLINYIENREVRGKIAPTKNPIQYDEQLIDENKKLWSHVKFFTENRRILSLYDQTVGKVISYRDISGKWMQRTIRNKYDIFRIIFDTFNIK